ncbi:FG-GAP-like repeat-containing protein [Embleya sp. NPDC005575]|uniref:FG-GAP-like repeat-containing protein n=1 Tax=Embleya sp. NPDC005575 TaxID=3156892 RepID=UPI0033A5E870
MRTQHRRGRALRRGSVAVVVAALWAGCGSWPTHAAEPVPAADTPAAGAGQSTPDVYAQAKAAGRPIEIEADRTPNTERWANPDGTVTSRSYLRPVRTNVDGTWRPVDATLRVGPDGRISPTASVFPISFSPGGTAVMASMTKNDKSLSLSWPQPLPRPILEGATARYPEVLPGVDLELIADIDGISQHLIVKNRSAAENPALKEIRYGLTGAGLKVTDGPDGGLAATDAAGTVVFKAPAPAMWDSGTRTDAGVVGARTAASTAQGPVAGGTEVPVDAVPVAVAVDGDALRLTPNAHLLTAPDTVFPVVIDPVFSDGWREDWTIAYKRDNDSGVAGTSFFNGQHFDDKLARVGYEDDPDARSYGTAESYFELNTDGLGKSTIISANVNFFNQKSWSCTKSSVELGLTGTISAATTWNNRPTWIRTLQSKSFAHGWSSSCTPAGEDFNAAAVKAAVQEAANGNWPNITLGLRAPGAAGKDHNSWKKFANNPALEVTYNHAPVMQEHAAWASPWAPGGSGNVGIRCDADPATWPTVGNNDIVLTARVSDADGGNVTDAFTVWEYGGDTVTAPTTTVGQNATGHVTIPIGRLQDGHRYKWMALGRDGNTDTGWTAHCGFNVDKIAPGKPTVTPIDGKRIDIAQSPARTPRTLRLRATDNVGIASFCYFLDRYLSTGNEGCEDADRVAAQPDPSTPATDDYYADITVSPNRFPESRLYVRAYDKAGNRSLIDVGSDDTAHQLDWATVPADGDAVTIKTQPIDWVTGLDSPGTGDWDDRDGDLDGDGRPDLVGVGGNGRLYLYPGAGDGTLRDPREIGAAGWTGAKITHRGDFTGPYTTQAAPLDGYEDYFVGLPQTDGSYRVFLYANDGTGIPDYFTRKEIPHPGGGNWPAGLQLVAPGDATGDGRPDLLTTEGTALVLYPGDGNGGLDLGARRVLNTWGWAPFDLYAAGDMTGDGIPDLISRQHTESTTANYYGKLNLYPGTRDATGYTAQPSGVYGPAGWNPANRPSIATVPNAQGTVEIRNGTRVWVPTTGKETPDFYATAPGGDNGRGVLYFYAGGPQTHAPQVLVGNSGWTTTITDIH